MSHFFFFNDTATTEIYTLSLHDALPISNPLADVWTDPMAKVVVIGAGIVGLSCAYFLLRESHNVVVIEDRKSTRLNSSHANISYAVFCLKKKKTHNSISVYKITLRHHMS